MRDLSAPNFCLDHIIVLGRDLDASAQRYRRLGFQLAPRMFHPFGTANHLIMFERNFVELLGITHPEKLTRHSMSLRGFLEKYPEALSHAAFDSSNVEMHRQWLLERGLDVADILRFRRTVRLPDGRTLDAVVDNAMIAGLDSDATCFLSRQHVPEAIWVNAWQSHPNGATALKSLVVVEDLADAALTYFSRLLGESARRSLATGEVQFHTPTGLVRILTAAAFEAEFLEQAPPGCIRFAGLEIKVRCLQWLRQYLDWARVPYLGTGDWVVVGAHESGGVPLKFTHRRRNLVS